MEQARTREQVEKELARRGWNVVKESENRIETRYNIATAAGICAGVKAWIGKTAGISSGIDFSQVDRIGEKTRGLIIEFVRACAHETEQNRTPTIFRDGFGNRATIEEKRIKPYNGATHTEPAFVLSCFADYDGGEMYFLSVYPSFYDARQKLKTFSAGTFAEVVNV